MRKINSSIIALSFFQFALRALHFADAAVPATAVTATRVVKPAVLDHSKMTKAELLDYVQSLEAKQTTAVSNFKIRYNDGTDPAGLNAKGEQGSKRDGGGISVYGFGLRPITLFAKQFIDLATKMPMILGFINDRVDLINSYVAKKSGTHANDIDRGALAAAIALFSPAALPLTNEQAVEQLEAAGYLVEAPESEQGSDSPEEGVGDNPTA